MKTWLIVDDCQDLFPTIRTALLAEQADVELRSAAIPEEAMDALMSAEIHRVVMRVDCESVDCLDLVCCAFTIHPHIEIVLCSKRHDNLDAPTSLTTGVCFVPDAATAAALPSPASDLRPGAQAPVHLRPDIVDAVRIVIQSGRSKELEVNSSEGRGLLGFVDGVLTHARAGSLSGSDAFFQMVLWEESSFARADSAETPCNDINIALPTDQLLDEAVSLRRAIEGDVPEPITTPGGPPPERSCPGIAEWWSRATADEKPIVRVLIGHDPGAVCNCAKSFSDQLAKELNPVKRWASEPPAGPSFIRLHSDSGSVLHLTFIDIKPGNRFYFETFSRKSEAVVICGSRENGTAKEWSSAVPENVRCVISEAAATADGSACPALRLLVEGDR